MDVPGCRDLSVPRASGGGQSPAGAEGEGSGAGYAHGDRPGGNAASGWVGGRASAFLTGFGMPERLVRGPHVQQQALRVLSEGMKDAPQVWWMNPEPGAREDEFIRELCSSLARDLRQSIATPPLTPASRCQL